MGAAEVVELDRAVSQQPNTAGPVAVAVRASAAVLAADAVQQRVDLPLRKRLAHPVLFSCLRTISTAAPNLRESVGPVGLDGSTGKTKNLPFGRSLFSERAASLLNYEAREIDGDDFFFVVQRMIHVLHQVVF